MIRSARAHLTVAALSHPGLSGKNNEDRFAVTAYRRSDADHTPVLLAVLADGIGGHRAGEVAANTITQVIAASDAGQPTEILQEAIRQASQRIQERAQKDESLLGMGSTCACVLIINDRLYSASVGDSRIYLVREEAISQITTDHTWIQEALDQGVIQPEQARGHPNSHVIRRYLGSPVPPQADLRLRLSRTENEEQMQANQGVPLLPADMLLVCSDGLTDLVGDAEILQALQAQPLEQSVQALIDLACQRGGHDNITAIAMQMPERGSVVRTRRARWPILAIGCLGLTALAAVLALGYYGLSSGFPFIAPSSTPTSTLTVTATAIPATSTPANSPVPTQSASTPLPPTITPGEPGINSLSIQPSYTPWPTNTLSPTLVSSPTP
jgi:serine/threonine protein phosphatase PrpC